MRREVLHSTALVGGESTVPFAAGPAAADLLASNAHRLPQVPRHDPERLVLAHDPLRCGLGELSAPAGPGIAPGLVLVPPHKKSALQPQCLRNARDADL